MTARSSIPREGRQQRIPPAPGWRQEFGILDELAEAPLIGLALWEGYRDVELWTTGHKGRGCTLFQTPSPAFRGYAAPAITLDAPELADAWNTLNAIGQHPDELVRTIVVEACQSVYAWAEERALIQTAAHFAEAAALLNPDEAALANLAARTCRRAGIYARAGPWYQRGRALAVRTHDFPEKFSASVGYGWLMYSLGRYDRARRIIGGMVRPAVNRGHQRMAGEAEHALLAICSEEGVFNAGESHARNALRHYPIKHERLPALVHDVGYFYVTAALYTPAFSILSQAVKAFDRPQELTIVYSSLARAAAGAAQVEAYATARDAVLTLAPQYPEHAPAALRNLAFAAQSAEEWDVAEHAAGLAAELAGVRTMTAVEHTSRDLLARVQTHNPGAPEVSPPTGSRVEEIVRLCLFKLRKWSGPKRGRPPGRTPPA